MWGVVTAGGCFQYNLLYKQYTLSDITLTTWIFSRVCVCVCVRARGLRCLYTTYLYIIIRMLCIYICDS